MIKVAIALLAGSFLLAPLTACSLVKIRNGEATAFNWFAGVRGVSQPMIIKGPITISAGVDGHSGLEMAGRNTGRIASLDEPMFSHTSAELGLWHPLDFVEQYGGGLMMLQAFDPKKIPVVFVHGISGSARSFEKVIEELNENEFQPWVLQYPSGVRLDAVSDYLLQALRQLYEQYRFPRIMIVAHSSGGLMARSFVMKYLASTSSYEIALAVTINTPLLGLERAALGVKSSPIVVPVWRDIADQGEYVRRVNAWRWPTAIPYCLMFSYLPGGSDDGVVPLASQLPPALQDEALHVHGCKGEHTAVLADPRCVARLAAFLSNYRTAAAQAVE